MSFILRSFLQGYFDQSFFTSRIILMAYLSVFPKCFLGTSAEVLGRSAAAALGLLAGGSAAAALDGGRSVKAAGPAAGLD